MGEQPARWPGERPGGVHRGEERMELAPGDEGDWWPRERTKSRAVPLIGYEIGENPTDGRRDIFVVSLAIEQAGGTGRDADPWSAAALAGGRRS